MKCVDLIYKDLYRVGGRNLIRSYFTFSGFKYLCVFRLIQSFKEVWYLNLLFFSKSKTYYDAAEVWHFNSCSLYNR